MTQTFQLLHPAVQRKLWDMKWTELRPIQVEAIEHLIGGTPTDCIIASPTASGKTEAAFLPVLSAIADEPSGGVRAMYIGPLKALINDQFGRIEQLCERMEMPVCRWHGDVDDGPRKALLARPAGILLITPESLEAMFVLRPSQLAGLFGRLAYVVIDEMHAFLGSPRGAQLISQLHRIRIRTGADPIRIGLSATLGDRAAACRWLRGAGRPVHVIEASDHGAAIRLKLTGSWRPASDNDDDDPSIAEVARAILHACRGKTNLVFANAKTLIEALADELRTQASAMGIVDEIVVHHGSLSKDEREHAETQLRSGRPCTAVCSNTLELGIDIGEIDSVVQVSPPWSVASLVQRLGRSGRREGAARVLRGYFVEDVPGADATLWDRLHLDFIRGVAAIELMIERWLEAPEVDRAHWSTLVQQVLSCLAETGGIRAHDLFPRLAESGAFYALNRANFAMLLRELGARDLIEQLPDATLVLGLNGQRIVEHYSFYAAFKAPAEFQVLFRDRMIGALPEHMLPAVGEHLILGGCRWLVEEIDAERRQVYVSPSSGRRPPRFASGQPDTDATVHARMRLLLSGATVPSYLDGGASEILQLARLAARDGQLDTLVQLAPGRTVFSLWAGTRIHRTLWLVLVSAGLRVEPAGDVALEIFATIDVWLPVLRCFIETPDGRVLAQFAEERLYARIIDGEKFDGFLPSELWRASYARERLDLEGTVRLAARIVAETSRAAPPTVIPDPGLRVVSIPNLQRWADAVVALETKPSFPTRLVLVPSEAHAHALRRELAIRAPHALAGTRFFTAAAAARAVLDEAGLDYQLGEEVRRPLRIRALLAKQPTLAAYRVEELRTPGWEDAFASTIEQLEAAALRPDDLEQLVEPRTNDIALIWRALDADAGTSWTIPRAMAEAAAIIRARPNAWPIDASVLAAVSIGDDAAHAALLRAIPRITLGLRSGRPARRRAVDRTKALLGRAAAVAMFDVEVDETDATELGILSEFLFEAPDRLSMVDRRHSQGPDGTVSLELHAGVDEELDAAVRWIADEVFERRTPLQELAILVPTPDPLATLVADRLRTLAWPAGTEPIYLAAGRPATATSAGSRLLAVVVALQAFLPAESVVEILPRLRLADGDGHVTPGRARALVNRFGTVGGSAARPEGAFVWCDRARAFAATNVADPDLATLVELANGLVQALAALVATMQVIVSRASLPEVWTDFRAFSTTHLIGSSELAEIVELLDHDIVALAADPVTRLIVGIAAVELIGARLRALRLHTSRFGDPAIYVGTIASAAGLSFSAVRMIGLAEGSFPGTQREDAVLPVELRRRLPAFAMANDEDHVAARLQALDQVVRGTTRSVALSAPRTDLDGSEREPAAVFIEAAAALRRPNAITGEAARIVPTISDLERDAFSVARRATAVRRLVTPLTETCWLQRVAVQRDELPSTWSTPIVGEPLAVLARSSGMNGVLGPDPLMVATVGTSAELPLSASALRVLLACPQRFLLERLLGFWPRRDVLTAGFGVDPSAYGALVHRVVEQFLVAHGRAFGARDLDLARWIEIIDAFACTAFDAFAPSYPFGGESVAELERRRLRRDVRTFIEDDWDGGRPRTFVAVEREFGKATPVSIATSAGPLFVSGRIDRIDIERGLTIVRDLKTGRARPREGELRDPDVELDLQLAVYAAVTSGLATELGTPADVAAGYMYIDHLAPSRERAFRDDRLALVTAGSRWFDVAMSVVRDQSYVKTPDGDDCRWCPFSAVCGDQSADTAHRLRDATGTLAAFRDLKA